MAQWTTLLDGSSLPDRALIGGKAWSVARMAALGLDVPPAFVITTKACLAYLEHGAMPEGLEAEIAEGLNWLQERTGRTFGGGDKRLLLSIRSGAAISMPGMMDTVLNLGIDDDGEAALAAETGLADFACDTHRRFLELYSAIVLKQPVELEHGGGSAMWRGEIAKAGGEIPLDVQSQLLGGVHAVFESWNTRRARRYRDHNNIAHDMGTAVTIQAMVFGNLDEQSGTGVLFSRNPLQGDPAPYGEYLPRAQGEDVVSGKFTPLSLDAMHAHVPQAHAALLAASDMLERENGDVQDIEFTVQSGKLYLLQSRSAKRAPEAAVRIAVDMVSEGRIDAATALSRVSAEQVSTLLLPRLVPGAADGAETVATGEGACPGVATGVLVADSDEAERRAAAGEAVILVRATTSPDDVHGMIAARAVVTEQGGSTSHAAVVSRALGRPCVVGVGAGAVAKAGQTVTVDGATGKVYAGALETQVPSEQDDARLSRLIGWARERSAVEVLRPAESDDGIDVDRLLAEGTHEQLAAALQGQDAARGSGLANAEIARIARRAGVSRMITEPVLPALLVALEDS
ncbi:pyruvate, phosphate dikinase [Novosphingobium sp. 9U]|uniref:pyruvate, phosphate dikinase n=1 Tax=Novosphingobium sp. 9U TaxID=2653158 RepID=UPI0012F059E8|nr:pyruvate, phosphate dikinase [Novosphingobium sp. 9U]VWX47311.1 Pyruvate, phosphate dikinase [Novosphingobium sp. 9U]